MRENNSNVVERKTFPVYNQRLAGFLMMRGYVLKDITPNEKYEGKNVFFFCDSPSIKKTMQSYFGNAQ